MAHKVKKVRVHIQRPTHCQDLALLITPGACEKTSRAAINITPATSNALWESFRDQPDIGENASREHAGYVSLGSHSAMFGYMIYSLTPCTSSRQQKIILLADASPHLSTSSRPDGKMYNL